ncbi:putative methyltransferase [Rozella allomycis CSF55]|uniref:tRNA (guanine-N(7)-)-methyltransferase n=1 Tax=Rozella allomycis (strain CSF55) TaxID=988480 RepID=A0A075AYU4_ROZAC|nr:tRNA (guanine-N-7) methyltransferase domain-containing protein [Rozella allomycis CSF55]RKP20222.1 putative methyltransferase [Rozella allomycis CSF55]|eukprot:EPZ33887.1 tRNA (guanine-N-7) methyltransferase domain-containing protein [Rozella allomycis CSF55]
MEEKKIISLPQKRYFRQRAHANPFSDHQLDYPRCPSEMNWDTHFQGFESPVPEFADVGCGYGGLLVGLSPLFPKTCMIGMEIRVKVSNYVKERIDALRYQNEGQYGNISIMRSNAMKFLPHIFEKGQLSKMFFLFPDPHFKKKKFKARIINECLLAEYAYCLKEGGLLYLATDVEDLHLWMIDHCEKSPLFQKVDEEIVRNDPVVQHVLYSTEEGKKVERNNGKKYMAVYERLSSN